MSGEMISPVHFGQGLFCYSIFSILTINKKQFWLLTAVTRIFNYSLRYISIITSNKTKWERIETSSNIYFIFKKMLQTFRKSICLVKEFCLINPFIGVFWGILRQVSKQLLHKTPLIFAIFSLYCQIVADT